MSNLKKFGAFDLMYIKNAKVILSQLFPLSISTSLEHSATHKNKIKKTKKKTKKTKNKNKNKKRFYRIEQCS